MVETIYTLSFIHQIDINGKTTLFRTIAERPTDNSAFGQRGFYAYLSSSIPASVAHRIIAFDTVITNVGNAYHPHMGTFIAHMRMVYLCLPGQ